jgi:membrane protein DedA with SNARE-associated domain
MQLLERLILLFAETGYLAVFAALLLCGAGAPLPEDVTLVAGGVIAGLGYANVHIMAAVALIGVLAGDAAMFLLGHHHGARIMRWPLVARLLTPARYARVQEKFVRYGNRLLFLARFLLLDGLAALVSVPVWVYLGYVGANNRALLAIWMGRGKHGLWLLGGLAALIALVLWWRHHRRARCGQAGD